MGVLAELSKHPPLLYAVILLSAVGGFLFGYDTGVIAGALPLVEEEEGFFPDDRSRSSGGWVALVRKPRMFTMNNLQIDICCIFMHSGLQIVSVDLK